MPTSQIHNEAVQVIHKSQAALPLKHRNMDTGSPLSSGKKSLEEGPMVPQWVSCFFRCFLAPPLTPPHSRQLIIWRTCLGASSRAASRCRSTAQGV